MVATGNSSTSGCGSANGRSSPAAEWGRPAQPLQAARRGGGDSPQREGDREYAGRQPGRQSLRRRQLAGDGSDADEHRHDRDDREREVGRAAHGDLAADEGDERREPQHSGAGADRRKLSEESVAPAYHSRKHELRPPLRFLRPHGSDRAEQTPDRGEYRETAAHTPADIAAHGKQIVRFAVEQPCGVVLTDATREGEPVRERRVTLAVGGGLEEAADGEEQSERDGADARIGEGSECDCASSRHSPLPPGSDGGRSPRARARGCSAIAPGSRRARR